MNRLVLALSIFLLAIPTFAQEESLPPPKSPRQAIVIGQQLVDAGELEQALPYLQEASEIFPNNDTVLAMYGQALYEAREIQRAETVFRRALVINPLNKVAKGFVEDIRETSAASVSLEYQRMQDITLDKIGDIIVLALGFLLASATGGMYNRFLGKRFVTKSRRHFNVGQFDEFADLLEIQLSTNELKPLRESLQFMLDHKSREEAIEILNDYVNNVENLATLTRMVNLAADQRDAKT